MPFKFTGDKAYHMVGGKKVFVPKKQAIAIIIAKKKAGKL